MFSNKALRDMIVPLFIEQFLLMFVGIADTFLVSFSSEADVSGVSLVTSFNTVLIFLFTALASGGAVIISQYIGSSQEKTASRTAGQLLMISTVLSVGMMVLIVVFRQPLLRLLFGKIESEVMAACNIYLLITTFRCLPWPFMTPERLCAAVSERPMSQCISPLQPTWSTWSETVLACSP